MFWDRIKDGLRRREIVMDSTNFISWNYMRFIHLSRRSFRSIQMNTLFFTHQHRRSTKTLRLHYGLEGMKYIIQVYQGEINGHDRRRVFPPNTNTSLNRRCWNTFTISRTRSERTDGFKEIPQRFPKPRFWGVKNQMLNWDLSLSKESTSSNTPPTYQNWWTDSGVLP